MTETPLLTSLPTPEPFPTVPAMHIIVPPDPPGAVPLLVPGTTATPPPIIGAPDWMRSPNCPNNVADCRITVTMTPVTTPVPPAIHAGDGTAQPPLVLKALPHGKCSVCKLSWDITRGPLGPTELPIAPILPPVVTTP